MKLRPPNSIDNSHPPDYHLGMNTLVLSIFPGIDVLGMGFEREGFTVLRGPDKILGGDIRTFHPPPGVFVGVIGGPPCQDFSKNRRAAPTGYGKKMLEEFQRVVEEARPVWWLMENVDRVPDLQIPGYSWQRIDLKANEFGLPQSRLRHIQFGHCEQMVLTVPRGNTVNASEPCCMATEGKKANRRNWSTFCTLQGLPPDFELETFSRTGRYQAVGNAVPLPMARALAQGIHNLKSGVRTCACGCGRPISQFAKSATATCRKRLQLRRDRELAAQLNSQVIHAP